MDLRTSTPNPLKNKFRKMKRVPSLIKAVILKGCKSQGAYIQFQSDVSLYNLWEALLYVEGYESDGYFTEGTAFDALDAFIQKGMK